MGVLIKGGEALERAGSATTVVLDKTGTITEGRPSVTSIETRGTWTPDELLRVTASVESVSEHPLAIAITDSARARGLATVRPESFEAVAGKGATATVEGRAVAIGNATLMRDWGLDPSTSGGWVDERTSRAETIVYVNIDGELAGALSIADAIRPTSKAAIDRLHALGIGTVLLTGDVQPTAEAVAKTAGIDRVIAGVLPAGKVDAIRALQESGQVVVMVGDGINDAPALAQADVGVAMGSGTDVAIEAGDIALLRSDLNGVADAIALSRKTMRTMRQNLFWAFIYNVVGVPIAAGILYPSLGLLLSPILASAAMALSSVSVVTNSLRLGRA
jgi:Cu+-exporting ATPase